MRGEVVKSPRGELNELIPSSLPTASEAPSSFFLFSPSFPMASHHGPSRPRAAPPSTADKYPGGGARQLDLELPSVLPPFPPAQRPTLPPFPSSSTDIHAYYPPSAAAVNSAYATPEDDWAIVCEQRTTPPVEEVVSPDALLDRGIADYNVVPGGRLGRGKFSVVYRAEKAGKEVSSAFSFLYRGDGTARKRKKPTSRAAFLSHPSDPSLELARLPSHRNSSFCSPVFPSLFP